MKFRPNAGNLTFEVLPNQSVTLALEGKLVASVAPEVFTEGWAKQSLAARPQGAYGVIPLAGRGRVGLQTAAKASRNNLRLRFTLTPLGTVRVIHLRLVVCLPYKHWEKSPFRLGGKAGRVPTEAPADIRIAEAQSTLLTLGPSPVHKDLTLGMTAPRLYTVLQDNRQWTPFLQAFVNRHEPAEPAWEWKKGRKKVFNFTLSFSLPIHLAKK